MTQKESMNTMGGSLGQNWVTVKSSLRLALAAATVLTLTQTVQAAEYLVKYRQGKAIASLFNMNHKIQVLDHNTTAQLIKVDLVDANRVGALLSLASNPNVEYIVENFQLHSFSVVPYDGMPIEPEALAKQWAVEKVRAEAAWAKAGNRGSKSIKVAVIDTGVDYRHKSLASNMTAGYDYAENDNDPMDKTSAQNPGHGTHCAGIVGANGTAEGGTIGLSPEVTMLPIRFLDERGSGDLNNGIKAIDFAIAQKVDVISASWGAAVPRSTALPLIEAVERANKAGIVFVAAAANDGKNNDTTEVYPANAGTANTIVVAASGPNDTKPSWSNYGRAKVHVSSPGEAIISTLPGDKYGNLSGTSMATPLVSGLVALLKAQDPSLTPLQMRSLLQATGVKVGINTACDCRVDALNAIETVKAKKMFVSPNAATMGMNESMTFTGVYGRAPFQFVSSNPAVAEISSAGVLTAKTQGEVTVSVTDAGGQTASSYKIYVGASSGGTDPGQPGQPGECPLGDPQLCEIICRINPSAPFCKK